MAASTYEGRGRDDSMGTSATGVGRSARSPSEIPARGWWQILKRVVSECARDRVTTEAAAVTFFSLLALFPAITALVSLYGLVADPSIATRHLAALSDVVPSGGMAVLDEQVQRLVASSSDSLGFGVLAGLATAIWSSNQGTKAMFDALNVVYGEEEKRGFIWRTLVTLAFTLGALVFVIISLAAVVALPIALNLVGQGQLTELLLRVVRWPILLALVTLLLAVLYRYGPSRERAQWRWVTWGSAFAAFTWLAASALFSWYVNNFANYDATYGSLGAVIGFMTWIWVSATVVLVGAEVNAEMEHQTAQDSTDGPAKDMGQRNARMADTLPE